MKLQHETIEYEINEAFAYLKKLIKEVKKKNISEEEFIPDMEHILWHLNFSINARFLSRKAVNKLSQKDFEKQGRPPSVIY